MVNVFILYGASTKRGTNNQTGGFGIGAKSAWSYTDSFTVSTVIDGTKRSYVAHTGVNNNGRLDLVSTTQTTEKNGTEIQVAVKREDVNDFRDAALRATYFWEEKPVFRGCLDVPSLVKGYTVGNVEAIRGELLPTYICDRYREDSFLVIDGIPYPIGQKLFNKCTVLAKLADFVKTRLIIHIETGVVEVSASRGIYR